MTLRTNRAPGEVGRTRTAGFVRAPAPGWRWTCRTCPNAGSDPLHPEATHGDALARLAAHQLAEHPAWVLTALAARAARKEAA